MASKRTKPSTKINPASVVSSKTNAHRLTKEHDKENAKAKPLRARNSKANTQAAAVDATTKVKKRKRTEDTSISSSTLTKKRRTSQQRKETAFGDRLTKEGGFSKVESILNTYAKPKPPTLKTQSNVAKKPFRKTIGTLKVSRSSSESVDKEEEEEEEEKEEEEEEEEEEIDLSLSSSSHSSEGGKTEDVENDEIYETQDGEKEEEEEEEEKGEGDGLLKRADKRFKKVDRFPDRLGKDFRISATAPVTASPSLLEDTEEENICVYIEDYGETKILEDKESIDSARRIERRLEKRRKKKIARKSSGSSYSSSSSSSDLDLNKREKEEEEKEENAEGSYVRITPIGVESRLLKIAKRGHAMALQGAAINDLMRVDKSAYCDNIEQDPLTNENYHDPDKTNSEHRFKDARECYRERTMKDWMNGCFAKTYASASTMALIEEYKKVEKTLEKDNERKNTVLVTTIKNLPQIDSSYIGDRLREPVLELGERRCVAGPNCESYGLYEYYKNNVPLRSSQLDPASKFNVDPENNVWSRKDRTARKSASASSMTTTTTAATQEGEGFILREFLLPEETAQLETEINMGIPMAAALEKIPRKHCVLCNRFLTTAMACQIASGTADPPTNTIQDHRNYFDCIGQYRSSDMLILGGDYCGIIGEMVGYNHDNYALATIEQFKYNTTTQEERGEGKIQPDKVIRLRSWVETNLVTASNIHEEGRVIV